ncbi:hypothetical protein AMQ84_15590 [Paenibacillus riograndensis]|uniref:Uncharacterized protein n=1 Tax=Paenibacillus riograndensis TaxID=483937 RepID=A0A132TYT6_9BACL|nr:hypothetical protein AMQ84_15590 [Paenibacillus riograndensis]
MIYRDNLLHIQQQNAPGSAGKGNLLHIQQQNAPGSAGKGNLLHSVQQISEKRPFGGEITEINCTKYSRSRFTAVIYAFYCTKCNHVS